MLCQFGRLLLGELLLTVNFSQYCLLFHIFGLSVKKSSLWFLFCCGIFLFRHKVLTSQPYFLKVYEYE